MNGLAKYQTQLTKFSSWQVPPPNLRLEGHEVHVWLARLDQENEVELGQIISGDEQARANRFRFEKDRKQFIIGRGLLRKILAQYLPLNPSQLRFEYNSHGKPFLGGPGPSTFKFNLSHSDNLALYAFSDNREIGIDLERIKPSVIDDGMISLCLTEPETTYFHSLSEETRHFFFFDCWTHKEAYLKAHGNGLLLSPNKIETVLFSKYPAGFFTNSTESRQIQLSFQKLPPIDGYATALAVEGAHPRLKFWRSQNP